MSLLTREQLELLAGSRNGPCVSIYLPTHKTGRDVRQDPIRFKNLLSEVQARLRERGMRDLAVNDFLAPVRGLLDDDEFWQHQSDGLAVFRSPDEWREYRLPLRFSELAQVDDRFYLKPLLPLISQDGRFYLIAISQKRVRLFQCTRFTDREIDLRDVPQSLRDAVGYDWEERSLQFHTAMGGRRALFHGQGAPDEDEKEEIAQFFRRVDEGVRSLLEDQTPPLVVAAADYEIPIYRDVSKYPRVVEEGVKGNPDSLKPDELREQAWRRVEPLYRAAREEAAARFHDLLGTGRASADLTEIVLAAHDGRVDTLFVACDAHRWGRFDSEARTVVEHAQRENGDADLLDLVAVEGLTRGGTVYALNEDDVPGEGVAAAIFRY